MRQFCLLSLLVLVISCQEKATTPEKKKPNVLFILVDDLGLHDLSYTGSTFYETPNVDRIAKEGVVFTQGYAGSRVCSPSRATIMTGKFTARHKITDWIGAKYGEAWREHKRHDKMLPASYVHTLPQADITIAEAMKAGGYKTFFAGKWHLGDESSYPENHGFDINIGGWDKGSPIGGYFSPWENPKLKNEMDGENLSMRLAKETASFIEKNKDTTFFAMLSFYAVHGPIQTTKEKWAKYQQKAVDAGLDKTGYIMERNLPIRQVQDNPIYAGLVEQMDDAVGLVLKTLDALGLDKNTIVVFTSDNGGVASGDSFSTANLPLRGGKGYQWEGGIREPYFIKAPMLSNATKSINYPVTGADLYPTLLDLSDIQLKPNQHIDGVSLKPLLEGNDLSERPLYWHYPHYGNQGGDPSSIIRLGNWKLIHYWEDNLDELYNLETDPGENNNIAQTNIEITKALNENLLSWLKSVDANMASEDTEYNAALDKQRHENIIQNVMPKLEKQRLNVLSKDFKPNENWWDSSNVTAD
ncbi:sulfatase [Aurantibacter crassamenti]|uniref:sulfatase n=1 Tax=Aurantibacter crassamenti TaxID=1837375 RepID=UPI0019395FE9|nr:sulfatase [Aurantibacter crassamenti]MBM1107215.1 sulfatase [Aurantibacter crassamenti]